MYKLLNCAIALSRSKIAATVAVCSGSPGLNHPAKTRHDTHARRQNSHILWTRLHWVMYPTAMQNRNCDLYTPSFLSLPSPHFLPACFPSVPPSDPDSTSRWVLLSVCVFSVCSLSDLGSFCSSLVSCFVLISFDKHPSTSHLVVDFSKFE